ncbi:MULTISPECIES: SDR family NAD(P)-dependent oxidoreductase [Streptomyces]|uniref:SDR family oxidoreductase n=1 Tax=Streptomyces lycii TaxID=2654337 RepID=A0ABQ7FKR1_9ACTN|nr:MULTISPECIES: SDR family oxidoreductase [Streptomyces]KAF4409542.1 SDR family oxidoreductase [Streptomyces lycii]
MDAATSVVVVTGGFGSLGDAIGRRAEREGATVVRTGRTPRDGGLTHDVRDAKSWTAVLDEVVERHGRIDALVNAAGQLGGVPQDLLSASPQQWHDLLDTHVVGTWLGCAEIIRRRPEHPVSIVNVSSTAGLLATPGMAPYGAMKAAVVHLTKSVALYCARSGLPVRCNAVAPALADGGVRDDVLATINEDPEQALAAYLSRVPLGRLVEPEEVADTAHQLITAGGASLTGQVLTVAGGLGLS